MRKLKYLVLLAFLFNASIGTCQVVGTITDVSVNGIAIPAGSPINLGTNSQVTVKYYVSFTKQSGYTVGGMNLYLDTYKNGSFQIQNSITPNNWVQNSTETSAWFQHTLYASDVDFGENSYLQAKLQSTTANAYWFSNKIKIIKFPVYTNVWHSPSTIACNSHDVVVFELNSNDGNHYSSLQWNYGSSWTYSGNTATGGIRLTPNTYPLGNVTVTPTIHGIVQGTYTRVPILAPFSSNSNITGNNVICPSSNSIYTITGLTAGNTVTWSSSNTAIATVSGGNQSQVTVNGLINGVLNLVATITNSCGQIEYKTKKIVVGKPIFPSSMSGDSNPLTGQYIGYSVPNATGAISYNWYFDAGGVLGTNVNGWSIQNGQGTTSISAVVGNPGTTVVVCKATNACGNTVAYIYANVRSVTDPCPGFIVALKNPVQSGENLSARILPPPTDPCSLLFKANSPKEIKVYDFYGALIHSELFSSDEYISKNINLKTGKYIVLISNDNGFSEKEILIVE